MFFVVQKLSACMLLCEHVMGVSSLLIGSCDWQAGISSFCMEEMGSSSTVFNHKDSLRTKIVARGSKKSGFLRV